MFSEKQILAYRSICAPEEIRESLVRASGNMPKRASGNWIPRLAALVAALVLVLGLVFFFQPEAELSVLVDGQELKNELVWTKTASAYDLRSLPTVSVPLEIRTGEETKITVSQGYLLTEEGEAQRELAAKENLSFVWAIPWEEDLSEAQMEIIQKEETRRIALSFDAAQNKILIKEIYM